MNRKNNWIWGAFFLIAAVAILFNQMFSFLHISPFKIALTVLLFCVIVKNIPYRNFFGILIPAAVIYTMYAKSLLWIMPFSGWSVIWASVFASIGLSIIFKPRPYGFIHNHGHDPHGSEQTFSEKTEGMDGDSVYGKVTMGSDIKYIYSRNLEFGQFNCTMGSLKIYLDQAQLAPGGAEFIIDVTMGSAQIFIPHYWEVHDNINAVLGNVDFKGRNTAVPGQSPRLILKGNTQLSSVDIIYV